MIEVCSGSTPNRAGTVSGPQGPPRTDKESMIHTAIHSDASNTGAFPSMSENVGAALKPAAPPLPPPAVGPSAAVPKSKPAIRRPSSMIKPPTVVVTHPKVAVATAPPRFVPQVTAPNMGLSPTPQSPTKHGRRHVEPCKAHSIRVRPAAATHCYGCRTLRYRSNHW